MHPDCCSFKWTHPFHSNIHSKIGFTECRHKKGPLQNYKLNQNIPKKTPQSFYKSLLQRFVCKCFPWRPRNTRMWWWWCRSIWCFQLSTCSASKLELKGGELLSQPCRPGSSGELQISHLDYNLNSGWLETEWNLAGTHSSSQRLFKREMICCKRDSHAGRGYFQRSDAPVCLTNAASMLTDCISLARFKSAFLSEETRGQRWWWEDEGDHLHFLPS